MLKKTFKFPSSLPLVDIKSTFDFEILKGDLGKYYHGRIKGFPSIFYQD